MQLGNLQLTSWIDVGLPEIVWLAMMHDCLGLQRGVEVALEFTRSVDRVAKLSVTFGSEFANLSAEQVFAARDALPASLRSDLLKAIRPFATLYPASVLATLTEVEASPPTAELLGWLKSLLADLMDRTSRTATLAQASAVYLILVQGRLQVGRGSSLSQIADIEQYPKTPESRRVASGVRATLNMYFQRQSQKTMVWPRYFWNRGFELEPCYFSLEENLANE